MNLRNQSPLAVAIDNRLELCEMIATDPAIAERATTIASWATARDVYRLKDLPADNPPAFPETNRMAPQTAPAAARNASGAGSTDLGMKGNWSPVDSTTAKFARPFAGEDCSGRMRGQRILIKGRHTAWLKLAGGVKARSPAGVPIAAERASRVLDFMKKPLN